MAPFQAKKRSSIRAKVARAPSSTSTAQLPLPDDSSTPFPSSKKDKRQIKHSSFVGRIEKSSSKANKRRRPNKKLVTTLNSLAGALPDLDANNDDETGTVEIGQAKIQRKSLKSRPGAMKRKEKLEQMERDRFNRNLAQMAAGADTNSSTNGNRAANSIADRWAALKSHVQNTMERKPEFGKG
ncbi:hypothetical protein EJ04DRAFT_511559 [Polyplosphaeria fusca]|uniref:Ribosome biogenesis protein SLX9 n=1 Tax=Polyplosphaeria fusca TaxID=682080 RepID=A0A9P4V2N2_9PLEO|nr:hypothetical protein EJ04DRAFT_511559 [Polyplosphaeria fusca]